MDQLFYGSSVFTVINIYVALELDEFPNISGRPGFFSFLANVNSRSRSLYAIAHPSVCRRSSVCLSSVTFVRPSQAVEIFGNISTALGTLAIR